MSKDVDRDRVLLTTRVRTLLKNDGSWIHRSKQAKEEQEESCGDPAAETKPVPVRQKSYVLSTAKKFGSVETPQSPPHQKTQFVPSEGDSANQANSEVIPPQKDAQPEGSTESTDDTKPQASIEERAQNGEAQPKKSEIVSPVEPAEQSVADTTAEEYVDASVESNIEHIEEAAETTADVCEEVIQNEGAQSEKSEAVSPIESAEQLVVNTTAEKKEECVDTPAEPAEQPVSNTVSENKEGNAVALIDQSKVEQNEETTQSSADAHIDVIQNDETQPVSEAVSPEEPAEQPVADTTAEKKEECVDTPAEPAEQPVSNTISENKEGNSGSLIDQSEVEQNEETVQSSSDVHIDVIQNDETQPVSEAVSPEEPAERSVADTTAGKEEESVDKPVDLSDAKYNKGAAEASAAAHVEDPVAKTSAEAVTEESKEAAEVPAVLTAELKPEVEPLTETEPANVTNHEPAGVKSTAQPAEGSCEQCPPEKYTEETVETVAEVVEESLPETPAVTNAAAAVAQEAAIQDSMAPVPDLLADTVSESPTHPPTETAVKSVESVAPVQSTLNTRAEEESKSEVQAAVEPAPKSTAGEMKIEDAVEPVTASDAEAAQDKLVVKAIELTDALDVEAPTAKADPEPEEEPKQSHSEEVKPDQKFDDANNTERFEKPVEDQSTQAVYKTRDGFRVCSSCDQIIDGNVKITFTEPMVSYHPECLKCDVCAEALGDLLTPMFLHDQLIHCGGCFAKALKT